MALRLNNRIAIITGGASGIGEATVLKFADAGARVIVADIQQGTVVERIIASHGKDRALFVHCDVTQESQIQSLVQQAVDFGGRVDVLVNSAGSSFERGYNPLPRVHEMETVDFDRTWTLNARGIWVCCKYVLQQMMRQEPMEPNARGERTRGWIVNVSSAVGIS